jgi:ATP-dependent DNA helicase RecG
MFSPGSTLNKKRSGQGDESRQRKRSEAHWSLYDKSSTTNLTLNKFFSKNFFMHAPRLLPRVRHPTAHNRLQTWWHLEFPFSTTYLAQVSNGRDAKKSSGKSSGKTDDKIIAIARKSPSVSIPQIAEILGISTRAVEKQIRQLKQAKRLRRIGPAKGGNWQVLQ